MASKSLRQGKKRTKRAFAAIAFFTLGRTVKACYKLDGRYKEEFNQLPDGIIIRIIIRPAGPLIIFRRDGDKIVTLKDKNIKPDIDFQFKNIEGALLALNGIKSLTSCYAEQRFIIFGDLSYATAFIRIMNITGSYLFYRMWAAYIFDNQAPVRERSKFRVYLGAIFGK